MAELDLIEVVEKLKLDYESDVEDIEQLSSVSNSSNKGNMFETLDAQNNKIIDYHSTGAESSDETLESQTRALFGPDGTYSIDAKFVGNIGKYFNVRIELIVYKSCIDSSFDKMFFPRLAFVRAEHFCSKRVRWHPRFAFSVDWSLRSFLHLCRHRTYVGLRV